MAAASYEARKFGVRSAMPSVTAKRQCPDLIFVKPRFEVYKAVSQQVRDIFAEHTPVIEPLSLDEAYLDVTEYLQNIPLARDVALAIRARIKEVTGLNASAAETAEPANNPSTDPSRRSRTAKAINGANANSMPISLAPDRLREGIFSVEIFLKTSGLSRQPKYFHCKY